MKILYIYHEYYDRRGRYADVMRGLGHHVDTIFLKNKTTPDQVTVDDLTGYDIVWLLSAHYLAYRVLTEKTIQAIKSSGTKLVSYTTIPTTIPIKSWLEFYRMFDLLFFQDTGSVDYLVKHGVKAIYMPLGFHPDQYPLKRRRAKYDITFMGNPQTNVPVEQDLRVKLINRLKSFNIVVFGDMFKGKLNPEIPVYSYKTHTKQVKVYSQSKINLDLPYINSALPEYRGRYHAKNRLFEIPATGNFLLTANCDEFRSLMGDTSCGFFQPEDIEGAVARYLVDDQLREEISENGRHIVKKHTFEKRFDRMFEIIQGYM